MSRNSLALFSYCTLVLSQLIGCTSNYYRVSINSYACDEAARMQTYVLRSADDEISEADLEFREFARFAKAALHYRGLTEVSDPSEADQVIYFGYGIGQGITSYYNVSIPVFGQTGVSSSHTSGYADPYSGSFSATTSYTPTYGVVGYNSQMRSRTAFPRHLVFISYANLGTAADEPVELWRTLVSSVGGSSDLRKTLPYLLVAARDHIVTNTGEWIDVSVSAKDKRIVEITDPDRRPQSAMIP